MNTTREGDDSAQDHPRTLRQMASFRHSMRHTLSPSVAEEGEGEGTSASAALPTQRRSTDLAQSMIHRRSLLSQIGSAQSSVASSVGSYSPSLTTKIDTRPAVVIEIGTRLTRIGMAGDYVPQEIFRTEFVDPLDGPPTTPQRTLAIFDRSRTEQEQYEVLVKFFKNIFFRKLLNHVNARRVVLVESLLAPNWQRNAVARALFECPSLAVYSILFAPSHLCCTFPFNTKNCLVIDLGADEAVLFPISEGVLMLSSVETSAAPCATALEQNVRRLVARFGRLRTGDADYDTEAGGRPLSEAELAQADQMALWEDVALRFCFATTAARGKRIQSHLDSNISPAVDAANIVFDDDAELPAVAAPAVELQFGAAHLLTVPGIVREGAAEVFFRAGDEEDVRSVTQMILDCVAKASIDLRREFLRNLLLVGGVTRLPGFLARLKSELLAAIADGYHPKLSPKLDDIRFYQFPADSKGQLFCAWLGGSLFGAFDTCLEQRSLTRDEWMETKRVPD